MNNIIPVSLISFGLSIREVHIGTSRVLHHA